MMDELPTNLLYFGDNLTWLREQGRFPDESVGQLAKAMNEDALVRRVLV